MRKNTPITIFKAANGGFIVQKQEVATVGNHPREIFPSSAHVFSKNGNDELTAFIQAHFTDDGEDDG